MIITLATCLFLFSPVAIASTKNLNVDVKNGGFSYENTKMIPSAARIQAAIVSLPEGEAGTIDSIEIIGPNNKREFGCKNLDVVNGTDLIKSCGGFADLKEGKTTYKASGSNFGPDANTTLGIGLES
ncbi:MAG: hypothetical protein QNJ70_01945 [Xenococcaceae cyanobacterium MO_207.B15]|nr:hypothetical protein [Xenococcaceae cyanobacterium MO_207.B15]